MVTEKRKMQLKESKEQIDSLSALIGDIMEGIITAAEAARRLGITPQRMNQEMDNGFLWRLHKIPFISKQGFLEVLQEIQSPYEKLFHAVFGTWRELGDGILLSEHAQSVFEKAITGFLNEQEQHVIRQRFGIGCREKCLQEIAGEMGIPAHKVRRQVSLALQKLRQPKSWAALLPEYEVTLKSEMELSFLKRRNKQYREKHIKILRECGQLLEENRMFAAHVKKLAGMKSMLEEELERASVSPLPFGEMSTGLANVLRTKAGVDTFHGLLTRFTKKDLMKLRGMGKTYMMELEHLLEKNGYALNPDRKEKEG